MDESEKKNNQGKILGSKIISILMIALCTFVAGKNLDLSFVSKSHFNIITINTVIIGFLFTSLSILLGLLNKKVINYLEDSEYMEKVFGHIKYGMMLACITISVCLINLIFLGNVNKLSDYKNYCFALELVLVIFVFIRFVLALFNMNIVVEEVRKDIKKSREEEKANSKISSLK